MSALFDPERHEPLGDLPWDEAEVRQAPAEIVDETLRSARDGVWPMHPLDGERAPSHTLYLASASRCTCGNAGAAAATCTRWISDSSGGARSRCC